MTSSNLTANTDPDKKENWRPTATRIRESDRLLIKQAVLRMELAGRSGMTVSDFMREAALEKAQDVLTEAA